MIQKEENNKIVGKFIGSKSKLISKVSIIDFNFEEISISTTTETDNINSNIIHARYHEEESISKASRTPDKFDEELISPEMQPPIMVPIDFTDDWLKERFSSKKKTTSAFENEEDAIAEINSKFSDILGEDISIEVADFKKQKQEVTEIAHMELPSGSEELIDSEVVKQAKEAGFTSMPTAQAEDSDSTDDALSSTGGLDSLGMETAQETQPSEDLSKEAQATIKSQDASMDYLSKQINNINSDSDSPSAATEEANQEFMPLDTQPSQGLKEVDKQSVENYLSKKELEEIKQQAYDEAVSNIDLDKIHQEAKSRGYEEGFKQGEAKASLSAKAETEEAMGKVGELVEEFEKLKYNILDNVQENFHEITQAVCEAVLDRSVTIDPSKFASVIKSAVDQAVEGDDFKVKVSPEKFSQLENLNLGSLTGKFVSDQDLAKDEFKVDSDLTSVSSSIKEIVLGLLEKADLTLFDEDDLNQEETDKVG
jgi:flagellar biosynthesis/type III secretory pathway protein FliH